MQETLVLIKPDAVKRQLSGELLAVMNVKVLSLKR